LPLTAQSISYCEKEKVKMTIFPRLLNGRVKKPAGSAKIKINTRYGKVKLMN